MEPENEDKSVRRECEAIAKLAAQFKPLGNWLFKSNKTGNVHDLSAADLDQIDRIESEGLFVKTISLTPLKQR